MACGSTTYPEILPWDRISRGENEISLYVPEKLLDLPYPSDKFRDLCLFFTSHLVLHWFQGRCVSLHGRGAKNWIQIPFYWIRWALTERQAPKVIAFLIEHGVIERDNFYLVGERSRHYRLTKPFRGKKLLVGFHNRPMWKKIELMRNESRKRIEEMPDETRKWLKSILEKRTKVNIEKAMKHIEESNLSDEQESYYKMAVSSLYRGDVFCIVSKQTGRMFTNVSNFPRILSEHLRIDGEELTEIDVKCSQPLLLTTLYPEPCEEQKRYAQVLENDDFYDYIARVSAYEYKDRNKLKEKIFIDIFFSPNKKPGEKDTRLWIGFKREFPILAEEIRKIKSGECENAHNKLALKLQGYEAQGIIDGAGDRLRQMGIPVLTIHDSVLCKKEDVEICRDTILENFRQILKGVVEPTVREKPLTYSKEDTGIDESESGIVVLSKDLIDRCRTNGTFTNESLRHLGIRSPLGKGWTSRLVGKKISIEDYNAAFVGRTIYGSGRLETEEELPTNYL